MAGAVHDAVLDGLTQGLGFEGAIAFLHDGPREVLAAVGSRDMGRPGAGSEVPFGQDVAGVAAVGWRLVKVSDLSRVRRFGAAVRAGADSEDRTRTIPFPSLPQVRSQIAVPLVTQGVLHGVLLVESERPLASGVEGEAVLALIAHQAPAALALAEASEPENLLPSNAGGAANSEFDFRVVHHLYDDSVFIENAYVIKGVTGRLLGFLLERHLAEGRVDFTNREIRLADRLRLPDLKDILETRLLLLRRRLEERNALVRILRTGRSRIRLEVEGRPRLENGT